jgi:trans-aconitate methyltransferase
VTFDVPTDSHTRFMGRYSEPLAVQFAELADVQAGYRALDVGCGPGALTAQLVERLGRGGRLGYRSAPHLHHILAGRARRRSGCA